MPDQVNPDEQRAFREGQFSARLDGHDRHFEALNGQMAKQADAMGGMAKEIAGMNDTITGMALVMPKLQTVADDVTRAEVVAETLRLKTAAERSAWDRYRVIVAWALGAVIALTVLANFARSFDRPAAPPAQTVTVQDITPGGP